MSGSVIRAALVVGSLAVAAGMVELGVRLVAPPHREVPERLDPVLGRVRAPGKSVVYRKRDAANVYDTNAQGFYDVERITAKTGEVVRVAAIGDSFVDAVQVPLEDTMTRTLERLLAARRPGRHEVLNLGRGGTGFAEYLLLLEHYALAYVPDLVLVFVYNENDFDDLRPGAIPERDGFPIRPVFRLVDGVLVPVPFRAPAVTPPAPVRSHALTLFRNAIWEHPALITLAVRLGLADARHLHSRGVLLDGRGYPPLYDVYAADAGPEWTNAFALGERLLLEMRARAKARGARFAVVSIPSQFEVNDALREEMLDTYPAMRARPWDFARVSDRLDDFARRSGTSLLRLDTAFRAQYAREPDAPLYFKYNGHWTAAGNAIAAAEVARFVDTAGLLPRPVTLARPGGG